MSIRANALDVHRPMPPTAETKSHSFELLQGQTSGVLLRICNFFERQYLTGITLYHNNKLAHTHTLYKMAKDAPDSARKEKKEKKASKHSDDAGVTKKSKKDKKSRQSIGGVDEDVSMISAAAPADEDKENDAMEVEVAANGTVVGALVPFANPLADEKTTKKVLKGVKKGNCCILYQV